MFATRSGQLAPLAVTAEHGWRTIRLLEMALESSAQRRAIPCDLLEPDTVNRILSQKNAARSRAHLPCDLSAPWSSIPSNETTLAALFSSTDRVQHFGAVVAGIDPDPFLHDLAFRIDQEGIALGH